MDSITQFSPSCKAWLKKDPEAVASVITQCLACGAIDSFTYKSCDSIYMWDIKIPEDFRFGDWDKVVLYSTRVALPIVACGVCGYEVRIEPSFKLKGSRLTLGAIAFITFAREVGGLKWRTMTELFCSEYDRCAHSTLYVAVHKVGKLLSNEVQELCQRFGVARNEVSPGTSCGDYVLCGMIDLNVESRDFSPPICHFSHTFEREMGARLLVSRLVPRGRFGPGRFSELFVRYIEAWNRVFSKWKTALPRLYQGRSRRVA